MGHESIKGRQGFTLLEVLAAVAIMALAFAIAWSAFSATVNGWRRGTRLLDQLHRGDYVMEQFVTALRSTASFSSRPEKYGFWLEPHGSDATSADVLSWVTSGTAFLPPDSPLANGLHRIEVSLRRDDRGRPAIAVRAWPHLADEDETDVRGDYWYVTTEVQGLRCRTYNAEEKSWDHEWEDTNAVPRLVELTLYLPPVEPFGEPTKLQRLIEIPVAPPLEQAAQSSGEGGTAAEGAPALGGGARGGGGK